MRIQVLVSLVLGVLTVVTVSACGEERASSPTASRPTLASTLVPTATSRPVTSPTVTPEADRTAQASQSAAQGPEGIRQVDFAQEPDIQGLLRSLPLAGDDATPPAVDEGKILFADLTGDGVEEAVVPIFAGGNIGDTAYFVYGYQNGSLVPLLSKSRGVYRVSLRIESGELVEVTPIYAPYDSNCCPSSERRRYYKWDGETFVLDSESTAVIAQPPEDVAAAHYEIRSVTWDPVEPRVGNPVRIRAEIVAKEGTPSGTSPRTVGVSFWNEAWDVNSTTRTALMPGLELALASSEPGVFTFEGSVLPATSGAYHLQVVATFSDLGVSLQLPTFSGDGDIVMVVAP